MNGFSLVKALMISLLCFFVRAYAAPEIVYLSWIDDPTTTMVIQWQSEESLELRVRRAGSENWQRTEAEGNEYQVYTAKLDQLKAGELYEFQIGDDETLKFKTLPDRLDRPVRFAVGGDLYRGKGELFEKMNHVVSAQDPDFAVLGGDIAYTKKRVIPLGKQGELTRWREFFKIWRRQMVTSEGCLIPMVLVVGNHDVSSLPKMFCDDLIFQLFAFPDQLFTYRSLEAGDYLTLALLDTGHVFPICGRQTEWLKETLEESRALYKCAVYHVGAYPTYYMYKGKEEKRVRQCWTPLFEKYGVQVAFEHHSHAYKRSYKLKGGERDEEGVLYLGDGAWGVTPRSPRHHPYLAESLAKNNVFIVELTPKMMEIKALGIEGDEIDTIAPLLSGFESAPAQQEKSAGKGDCKS